MGNSTDKTPSLKVKPEDQAPDALVKVLEQKRCLFNRVFGAKYSLNLLELRGWINQDGRILKEVSFSFGELMTALDIRVVCEKLAKWLGGDLMGTVNLKLPDAEESRLESKSNFAEWSTPKSKRKVVK